MHTIPVEKLTLNARYGRLKTLCLQAFLSALVIVFYTTQMSLTRSLFKPAHMVVFAGTFCTMLLVVWLLAVLSKYLDRWYPWHTKLRERRFWQIAIGVVLVSFLALWAVYYFSEAILGLDLKASAYLERDFVVVVACLALINISHRDTYNMALIRFLLNDNENLKKQYVDIESRWVAKRQKLDDAQAKLASQQESAEVNSALRSELNTVFQLAGGVDEDLKAAEAVAFCLKEGSSALKVVHAILWDGSEVVLDGIDTLGEVENCLTSLFVRVSRNTIVNSCAIRELKYMEDGKYKLLMRNPNMAPIGVSTQGLERVKSVMGRGDRSGQLRSS